MFFNKVLHGVRYHLASWVNITEQWPYRASWIILYYELNEGKISDFAELKVIYDRVKPLLPASKEKEPLLEIDNDEKKLEIFLTSHCSSLSVLQIQRFYSTTMSCKFSTFLQVLHLKIFMPFTIHLDPHLRQVIKEQSHLIADLQPVRDLQPQNVLQSFKPSLPSPLWNQPLSMLSPEDLGDLLRHLDGLQSSQVAPTSTSVQTSRLIDASRYR